MCVSPIDVKIKRIDNCNGYARTHYSVPCGKCWQCRLNKQNSYFVRSFYQYLMCKQYGGYSSFITLTHSNDTLNKTFNYGIPVFDKPCVQRYIKRVRKRIALAVAKNKHISVKDAQSFVSSNVSYLCVSEYGEDTHRPHYHMIWHLHKPIIDYFAFARIIKDAWSAGFTRLGDNFGLINSENGIKYVCKYISKTFLQDSHYSNILRSLQYNIDAKSFDCNDFSRCNNLLTKSCSVEQTKNDLEEFVNNKPFILLSQRYGMFAFDRRCPYELRLTKDDMCNNLLMVNKKNYTIPSYYRRKVCYDVRNMIDVDLSYKVQYALNETGIKVHRKSLQNMIDSHRDRLYNILSPDFVNDSSIKRLNRKFKTSYNKESFIHFISSYTRNFSQSFVDYSFCFRHYKYLVPYFDSSPVNSVPVSDVCGFMDLISSNSSNEINHNNIDGYLPFLKDVAETCLYYDVVFPEFSRICHYLDYLNKYYGAVTQNKHNYLDVLNYSRKKSFGLAL